MATDIPANWYPDAHGTIRWWDGDRWTDYVRGEVHTDPPTVAPTAAPTNPVSATASATAVLPSAATTQTVAPAETPAATSVETSVETPVETPVAAGTEAHRPTVTYPRSAPSTVTSRVIYPVNPEADEVDAEDADHSATRRVWLTATAVGLAALFLGMGMGSRNQPPQALPSPEPTPVVVTDSPELDQREADLDERESQLDDREAELNKRQSDLDNRKAELDRRALETPTPTATATATATRIGGEETVLVGTDVRSGTYRTSGPSDPDFECRYTISRDSAGSDVIDDGRTSSSATVSLRDGEYFDSDDCQDWTRE
jgi:hypothetical protein